MSAAPGPPPGVGVVIQRPRHHVGLVALQELLALVVIVVRHIQPVEIFYIIILDSMYNIRLK